MKPEDLKHPYKESSYPILIKDRVFFVPEKFSDYTEYTFPGWIHQEVFASDFPIKIEFCSGNGTWIARKAQENPQTNWVAVEKRFMRARKIWSKVKNHSLDNLFTVCGEAFTTAHHYFPTESVSEIFINFPDPWPKRRHAKYRLLQASFVEEIARILKQKGLITLVTDDPIYSKQMIEQLSGNKNFISSYPDPFYITDYPGYGTSSFDDLWRSKGRVIHYHQFQRV